MTTDPEPIRSLCRVRRIVDARLGVALTRSRLNGVDGWRVLFDGDATDQEMFVADRMLEVVPKPPPIPTPRRPTVVEMPTETYRYQMARRTR